MAQTFEGNVIRRELVKLYQLFLSDPTNKTTKRKLLEYDRHYGGLTACNDYLNSRPIPRDIEEALGGLIDISLNGEGFRNKEECISFAKRVVSDLKSNL